MTRLIKVDLIVWIIIHAFGGSSVTSKIQVYLVIVTHARQRESTLFKYLHTFFYGIAVMWDTCKGWWEGKIKVEVDEVLLLHRSRGDRHCWRCGAWLAHGPCISQPYLGTAGLIVELLSPHQWILFSKGAD